LTFAQVKQPTTDNLSNILKTTKKSQLADRDIILTQSSQNLMNVDFTAGVSRVNRDLTIIDEDVLTTIDENTIDDIAYRQNQFLTSLGGEKCVESPSSVYYSQHKPLKAPARFYTKNKQLNVTILVSEIEESPKKA